MEAKRVMEFKVGQTVEIRKRQPGASKDLVYGQREVTEVKKLVTTLSDGTKWRTTDGYYWGSKPTRGIGRTLERQIHVVIEIPPVVV